MKHEIKFYEQGIEEYPVIDVIKGNLLIALWIGLGTIASWSLHAIAGWI